MLYAFDLLGGEGEDLRSPPLSIRKAGLHATPRGLRRRIFIAEYEQGDGGDVLFKVARNMGLEGIVSKHLDRPTAPAGADIGSRSRTPRTRLTAR
jgi:bifunctional non-homologous end joining protein LigD